MGKITVFGSFIVDNVARMDSFPQAGQTVIGASVTVTPGGKGINQCVAAARLGGDCEMVGMLGRDSGGDTFRRILTDEGIAHDCVFACDLPTGTAQVQIEASGQNRICIIPSANHAFGVTELDAVTATLANTETVICQLEMRYDVTFELMRRAKAAGKRVILNPAPAVPLSDEVLALCDILTPNETELAILSGLPTETDAQAIAAAQALRGRGVSCIVATLGARGALIVDECGDRIVPGYPVKAIDTVAAGDSFNGALAVALCEGMTLEDAVSFANAVGALTVTKPGAVEALPHRSEVEFLMSKHKKID